MHTTPWVGLSEVMTGAGTQQQQKKTKRDINPFFQMLSWRTAQIRVDSHKSNVRQRNKKTRVVITKIADVFFMSTAMHSNEGRTKSCWETPTGKKKVCKPIATDESVYLSKQVNGKNIIYR
jgi:hypothetical protein